MSSPLARLVSAAQAMSREEKIDALVVLDSIAHGLVLTGEPGTRPALSLLAALGEFVAEIDRQGHPRQKEDHHGHA